ncbi:MAG: 4Fe-4S binding protein [Tepidanaerobacteraceae bacterium]|jgi:dihydroorotate dehydrogenase (NAD+) catalytic subunit
MDLSVKIGNVVLKSPVIVSSGVDGRDGARIKKVAEYGPGAITTKTIVANPLPDPLPCIKSVKAGMLNCVFGTTALAKRWCEQEFEIAKQGGVPIIANLAGTSPEESVQLAKDCEAAGADIIEYPSACPHMGGILEAMFPGLKVPLPEVHDPSDYAAGIRAMKKVIKIPLMAKLSAIHHLNVKEWAKAIADAGADAIAAADTIGPAMAIDIETGMPLLGGPKGFGGLSGAAIKPLITRMVLEIREVVDIPIIAIGGVASGNDAVEYIMAGADAVGVATASNLKGPETYRKIRNEIEAFMKRKGYDTLADFKGLTLKRINERFENKKHIINTPVVPEVDEDKCTSCGSCVRACVYEAITMEDYPKFNSDACYGCGLCVSVCPTKAIIQNYY